MVIVKRGQLGRRAPPLDCEREGEMGGARWCGAGRVPEGGRGGLVVAGAAGRQRKVHTIERSVADLFGTLQLTLQLVALVSSLLSLMPSSTRTWRAPPSRS